MKTFWISSFYIQDHCNLYCDFLCVMSPGHRENQFFKLAFWATCNPWTSCATHNRLWRTLAFFPLLTWSPLTRIGMTYTQLVQEKFRSFQWCPDQSDWHNGAWTIHKNAQKFEWKTQSKIFVFLAKSAGSQWVIK